jgi:hypothetical protein
VNVERAAFGGVYVENQATSRKRQLAVVHDLLTDTVLNTHLSHYENNWASTFSLAFDLTGETGLTVAYARPPQVSSISGRFRVSNLMIEV